MNDNENLGPPQSLDHARPTYHWEIDVDNYDPVVPSSVLTAEGVCELQQPISGPLPRLAVVWSDLLEEAQQQSDWPLVTFNDDAVFRYRGIEWPWADEVLIIAPQSMLDAVGGPPLLREIQKQYRAEGAHCAFLVKDDLDGGGWVRCSYLNHDNIFLDEDDEASDLAAWEAAAAASAITREAEPELHPGDTRGHEAQEKGQDEDELPTPKPFNQPLIGPEIPVEHFPTRFRKLLKAVAKCKQTPLTAVITFALGMLSILLANRLCVQPKKNDSGYIEYLVLMLLVVMTTSGMKTGLFEIFLKPLQRVEESMRRAAAIRRVRAIQLLKELDAELERLGESITEDQLQKLAARRAELERDRDRKGRLLVSDITPEGMALLAKNEGMIAICMDEVHTATLLGSRWGNSANMTLPLQGYSGSRFSADRATKEELVIDRPLIPIIGGTQPSVVSELFGNDEVVSRGLAGRLLVTFPGHRFGDRVFDTPPLPEETVEYYTELVDALASLETHDGIPPRLTLDDDAFQILADFFEDTDRKLGSGSFDNALFGFAGKMHGNACRIAGILHVIKCFEDDSDPDILSPITGDTMSAAVEITRCLADHAKLAYDCGSNAVTAQRAVFAAIVDMEADEFTQNGLFQRMKGSTHIKRADDLRSALGALAARKYILPLPAEDRTGPGRKPSPRYAVNPRAVDLEYGRNGD